MTGTAMLRYLLRLKGAIAPGGLNALCDELLQRVNPSLAEPRVQDQWFGRWSLAAACGPQHAHHRDRMDYAKPCSAHQVTSPCLIYPRFGPV